MPSLGIPYLAPFEQVSGRHICKAFCVRTMVYAMGINSTAGSRMSVGDYQLDVRPWNIPKSEMSAKVFANV